MATLKDVAEKAGVTVTTVSRMLNNRGYISEKTRENITNAMKELNYQPNEVARSLSLQKSSYIGLIVPSTRNMFFCKIIDGIEKLLSKRGYKLLLCNSNMELNKEIEYFDMLNANKVAGVIIASHTEGLVDKISFEAPIVTLNIVFNEKIPSVCSDMAGGGRLVAQHLIDNGCKKLAYIRGSEYLTSDETNRYLAFKEICEENNIQHVVFETNEEQFQEMRYDSVIQSLLCDYPEIDGVFASNDIIAAQIIQRCYEKGIEIPEKLKVIGYDDIDLCRLTTPQITTIRQPYNELCQKVTEHLFTMIEEKVNPGNAVIPVTLVERDTVKKRRRPV